jgi:hypothetical protein
MLLITAGRYFPKPLATSKIFCPHENCVREGAQIQYRVMVGLFFVPLVPAARVTEWKCAHCNRAVIPNQKGEHSGAAGCGLAMFVFFAFMAFYVGGKNSAFDPSNINATRGFLGLFAFLGLLIVGKALADARKIASIQQHIVTLSPEKSAVIEETLELGDGLDVIVSKLAVNGFSDAEIRAYSQSWSKPVG